MLRNINVWGNFYCFYEVKGCTVLFLAEDKFG